MHDNAGDKSLSERLKKLVILIGNLGQVKLTNKLPFNEKRESRNTLEVQVSIAQPKVIQIIMLSYW